MSRVNFTRAEVTRLDSHLCAVFICLESMKLFIYAERRYFHVLLFIAKVLKGKKATTILR